MTTHEDARDLLFALEGMQRATGFDWRQYFAAWLIRYYEEQGNARFELDRSKPLNRWRLGDVSQHSTVLCLMPKRENPVKAPGVGTKVKTPMEDGYVTFDIPKFWHAFWSAAGRPIRTKKIAVHRLVALASQEPPRVAPGEEIYEAAHWCGNEPCAKHSTWLSRSRNQAMADCFKNDAALRDTICNKHGNREYCIRDLRAARPADLVLIQTQAGDRELEIGGLAFADRRPGVEAVFWTRYVKPYLDDELECKELLRWFYNLNKTGGAGGKTGVDRFFERLLPTPVTVRQQRADYVGVYDALQAAYIRGGDEWKALITDVMRTPIKNPATGRLITPERLRDAGGGVASPPRSA